MRPLLLSLAALAVLVTAATDLRAQFRGPPPGGNFDPRAYQHFLNSPYSYRTYSALTPGRQAVNPIPFGYQSYYVQPGSTHQRITPWGYEGYDVVPGYGGSTVTPFGYSGYSVPGQTYQYYAPYYTPAPAPAPGLRR